MPRQTKSVLGNKIIIIFRGTVELTAVCEVGKQTYGLQATRNAKGEFGGVGAVQR